MDLDLPSSIANRFIRWCRACNASEAEAEKVWPDLSALYQESHRHYHTLAHIAASLAELDATGKGTTELEGAIWFHDVIYEPTRADNEDASITWFVNVIGAWLAPATRNTIARLIAATDFRKPRNDNPDEALMVDIDLAILSADWPVYDTYRRSVRREYAHVPDEAFRSGRAKVMASFLAAPVYRTPDFTPRETRAQGNITREIAELGSAQPLAS